MVSLEFSQEPCPTITGESDEWTDDNGGALHPLPAAEHQVSLCNEVTRQANVSLNILSLSSTLVAVLGLENDQP